MDTSKDNRENESQAVENVNNIYGSDTVPFQ